MEILSDPTPDMLAMPRFDDGAIDMQELLRRLAEQVVNAVMDAEADQLCGGGATSRNGYRERSLATCVGTLTPRIPKLRSGSFFPDDVTGCPKPPSRSTALRTGWSPPVERPGVSISRFDLANDIPRLTKL